MVDVDPDDRSFAQLTGEEGSTDPCLQLVREVAPERSRAVDRIVTMLHHQAARVRGELEGRTALGQPVPQVLDLEVDYLFNLRQGEPAEQDDVIDAVEELGPEMRPELGQNLVPRLRVDLAIGRRPPDQVLGS